MELKRVLTGGQFGRECDYHRALLLLGLQRALLSAMCEITKSNLNAIQRTFRLRPLMRVSNDSSTAATSWGDFLFASLDDVLSKS